MSEVKRYEMKLQRIAGDSFIFDNEGNHIATMALLSDGGFSESTANKMTACFDMYEALLKVVDEFNKPTDGETIGSLIARIDNANHFIKDAIKKAGAKL